MNILMPSKRKLTWGQKYTLGLKAAKTYAKLSELQSSYAAMCANNDVAWDERDEANWILKATFDVFSPYELASVLGRMVKSKSKGK